MDCIFCKIIKGEIPSAKVFENDKMIIINDIQPQAEKHYLLIPKAHYANIKQLTQENATILGECLMALGGLIDKLGLQDGFRIVSNCGENACQTVGHLHIHVMGGQKLSNQMA